MAITLTQLSSFLAVVRSGSITAAAERLAVTQPSVSAALAALSRELGVDLTEPVGRSVRPSAAGRAFAPYATRVIATLEEGARAARDATGSSSLELRLAAATSAGEYLAPALLAAFSAAHPEASVSLTVTGSEQALERLAQGEVDVVLAGPVAGEGGLASVFLATEALVLVAAPGHRAAGNGPVALKALTAERWLLPGDPLEHRDLALGVLGRRGLGPSTFTAGSNEAIKRAAEAGLGVALVPERAVRLELDLGRLVEIPVRDRLPAFEWLALHAAGVELGEPAERFLAWLRSAEARAALE